MLRKIDSFDKSFKTLKRSLSPCRREGKENDSAPQSPNVATTNKKVAFGAPGGTSRGIGANASPYKSSVNA